jgi:hypothetical protein
VFKWLLFFTSLCIGAEDMADMQQANSQNK